MVSFNGIQARTVFDKKVNYLPLDITPSFSRFQLYKKKTNLSVFSQLVHLNTCQKHTQKLNYIKLKLQNYIPTSNKVKFIYV